MTLHWRNKFKIHFDVIYELIKHEIPDIRFPCYGGRFWWRFGHRRFDTCYLYLSSSSFVYTYSGGYKYEIPFNEMKKVTVKNGFLLKNHYHIRFRTNKNYHFIIYDIKDLETELTGKSSDNVINFINTLIMKSNSV